MAAHSGERNSAILSTITDKIVCSITPKSFEPFLITSLLLFSDKIVKIIEDKNTLFFAQTHFAKIIIRIPEDRARHSIILNQMKSY